ncbi:prepilin peptidase [Stenotrophomonas sp. Iso1]|uniref:A24 family peptidase n=1 Tax=Stenotrophomonas sp. Iso1 TaxID=2977283 RepID=UPI0022B7D11A|nr:prepilin peptidase [Stenotrophomonas sp. Iso1]
MTLIALTALLLGLQVAISDLTARRVSNRALLAVLGMAVFAQAVGGATPSVADCLLGGVIGLAVLLPFHLIGWMGAGDVKLFSTIGFLLGAKALLPIWVCASLAAGGHALLVVTWPLAVRYVPASLHKANVAYQGNGWLQDWQLNLRAARQGRAGIPYAAYLGIAMIGYVLHGGGYV